MKYRNNKLNVVIPMAGLGSRFQKVGYELPKPLIDVNGQPMVKLVVESMNIDAHFIYIVQKEHRLDYPLDDILSFTPNFSIVEVDGLTEGAACSVLASKELINNDNPLIIMNSDQLIIWDSNDFMGAIKEYDGAIMCFEAYDSKWSFARVNPNNNLITEVAEKNPISNKATAGIYYWKYGSDFVKSAEQMIEKNIRVNNEFYVCPVYNEAIGNGLQIYNYMIESKDMWGLGTPEDLEYYLKNYK
jgi:dTDP-glucose pyrophosphorylase